MHATPSECQQVFVLELADVCVGDDHGAILVVQLEIVEEVD